jgi:predicted NBD/HSP70 family sugar kinase
MGDVGLDSRPPFGAPRANDLFQLLRDGEPRTRAELAKITGLARSTIANRVESLITQGFLAFVGDAVSTGGRPPSQFALNHNARLVLAADIGATHAHIGLTDLAGRTVAERKATIDVAQGPDSVLGFLVEVGQELLAESSRPAQDIIAVGIGLPGPVQHETGRPTTPPLMPGWDNFDVCGFVRETYDVPVLVDKDVNIMALGERAFAWRGAQHFIFVKIATGIGAGIVSGGVLQRGAQGIAGDIGHIQIPRGAGTPCHCGNMGCLEAIASGPAILADLQKRGLQVSTNADLQAAIVRGDREAIQAVRQAGRDIGEVLSGCVNIINPSVIAFGGSMSRAGEHLIAGVREVVYARSLPMATEHLAIVQSEAGENAALLGASMLAIDHALSPDHIDRLTNS